MGDDREFIDLDSTQNWSQLDVKRELDNLEVDAETGKKYDFARGFSDDMKEKEDKVILDGLTSGLNYIPEEFLMAADEKKDAEMAELPDEEKPDVSWAYRDDSEKVEDDEPFVAIADIKAAEARAAEEKRIAEARAAEEKTVAEATAETKWAKEQLAEENAKEAEAKAKAAEVEAIRAKNLEEQARRIAEANASDDIVKANIEARKQAREAIAAENEAKIRAAAEAKKEAQKKAEEEMYKDSAGDAFSNQFLDLDDLEGPVMTKAERIAAANKNRHNVTEEIVVPKEVEAETVKPADDVISEVTYEMDEVEQAQIVSQIEEEKTLSTGDTGVIYFDDDGEPINQEPVKTESKKAKAAVSASEGYAAWADGNAEEEVEVVRRKKKKKKKRPEVVEEEIDDEDDMMMYMGFFDRVVAFFKNMSGLDMLVMSTGVLVVIVAIITLVVYSSSRATQNKINEFGYLGENMQAIGLSGGSKLVAVADAKRALNEVVEEIIEEEEEENVEYNEKEEEKSISVTMTLTSVKKDLKIKFINAKTKKLVGNYEFKVDIEDNKGKKYSATDDDKDGIIYLNSVEPGKAKVSMVAMDNQDLKFSTETVTVTIKENIDYKKIDVSDEVKKESEINANKEDTAAGMATEGSLKDTVEWVESSKKLKDDAKLRKIGTKDLDNLPGVTPTPAATKSVSSMKTKKSLFDKLTDLFGMKAYASCETHTPDGGSVADEATCTKEGVLTFKCTVCGEETGTQPIAKIDHTWEYGAEVAATCIEDGYVPKKCSVCGTEDKDKKTDKLGHKFENGACTNPGCSEKDPSYVPSPSPTPSPSPSPTPSPTPSPVVSPSPSPAACVHKCGADGVCTKCGVVPADSTTALLCKGKAVYLDAEGKIAATYADYYKGTTTFYVKPEPSDMGGDSSDYIYTGWQELNGSTYYFDKNGNYVTGEQVIQGAKYNFDSTGALVKGSGTMGIDVSKWNGNINWTAVKNSGVSFVIIRCGYRGSSTGALVEDPKFKTNIKGATDAGLKVGIYFFSQAVTDVEAVEEASMAINLMKGYKVSYPVFLDVEDSGGRGDRIDANTRTQVIKAFCETVKNSGYTAGVYANKSWLNTKMNVGSLSSYKIWLAQYNTEITYTGKVDMWQYSSKGSVGGISGNTDMNLSYLGY